MSTLRFFAVIVIFGAVTLAWMVLGTTMWARTELLDSRLSKEMASRIGPRVVAQAAPYWTPTADGARDSDKSVSPTSSEITAHIEHDDRYMGLLWYSTFNVQFSATYTLPAVEGVDTQGFFIFELPWGVTKYSGLRITVDEQAVEATIMESYRLAVSLDRSVPHSVSMSFSTFGQDVWLYTPGEAGRAASEYREHGVVTPATEMTRLDDLSLTITTNFHHIDYPKGTASPTLPAAKKSDGMTATWKYDSLVTNQAMGMVMPKRVNAGPIAARMSFFAPVSLFFFFTALFTVVVLKKIPLHPMHYMFISAAFFSFHILLAYLADQVSIHAAFWICAAVSTVLVVSYMRLVAGMKFAATYVAAAQLVYLVGFSYAFFWEGKTGLTITVGAIATLFVLMMATGRVDWSAVFKRPDRVQLPTMGQTHTAQTPPPPPGDEQ